jgi:hypothetical protein
MFPPAGSRTQSPVADSERVEHPVASQIYMVRVKTSMLVRYEVFTAVTLALMMEAMRSSETSALTEPTQRHIFTVMSLL